MKKLIALVLIISFIVAIPGYLAAKEKLGAEVIIETKDGELIEGELIAVKRESLLLKSHLEEDMPVQIHDVVRIRIVNKSYALLGLGLGSVTGVLLGLVVSSSELRSVGLGINTIGFGKGIGPDLSAFGGGIIGGVIGLGLGVFAGIDENIHLEGKSESEIEDILEKLSKKARMPNYN